MSEKFHILLQNPGSNFKILEAPLNPESSHPSIPNLSFPICHYNSGILTICILKISKSLFAVTFIFQTCKNIFDKYEQ